MHKGCTKGPSKPAGRCSAKEWSVYWEWCCSGEEDNTLNADGVVVVRVRCAWKKIRELTLILNFKEASFKLKSKAYGSCVLRCMMYGSETWPMKK